MVLKDLKTYLQKCTVKMFRRDCYMTFIARLNSDMLSQKYFSQIERRTKYLPSLDTTITCSSQNDNK